MDSLWDADFFKQVDIDVHVNIVELYSLLAGKNVSFIFKKICLFLRSIMVV